jgi:MFS family permease
MPAYNRAVQMALSSPTVGSDPSVPGHQHSILRAFRHRNYRLFFGGQIVSLVGTFLTQYATIWFVYRLTHSLAMLGTVGFVGQLPLFLLTPFAGVYADRVHRRNFIVLTQALSMFQSLGLAAVAFWFGHRPDVAVPCLFGLAIIQGCINAFDMPARQSFLVEMVTDRADVPNAIALNSTMVHGARIIGPAAAGLVIQVFGESLCFLIDAVSYLAVIAALLAMVVQPIVRRQRAGVRAELMEGLRYVWDFTPVRTLLIFLAVLSLTGLPAVSILMPVFGDHFGGHANHGPATYGTLGSASGLGALIGAIWLAGRKSVLGLGRLIAIAVGVFSISLIAFSLSRQLWLSLLIMPFGGWGMITSFASANTIIQTLTDDNKRGRVMSMVAMAFLGMAPFGNLLAGKTAQWLTPLHGDPLIGASRTLMISGVICLIFTGIYLTQLPAVRRAARPIYVARGIIPEVATALQATDEMPGAGE